MFGKLIGYDSDVWEAKTSDLQAFVLFKTEKKSFRNIIDEKSKQQNNDEF